VNHYKHCGDGFEPKRYAATRFCSTSCNNKARYTGGMKDRNCRQWGNEFSPRSSSHTHCSKPCADKSARENYARHYATPADLVRANNKAYAANRDPDEKRIANRASRLKADYGLTPEQFDAAIIFHLNLCEVCGSPNMRKGDPFLVVDHDHATGAVRGFLCDGCNKTLGFANDDPSRLRALANYIDTDRERVRLSPAIARHLQIPIPEKDNEQDNRRSERDQAHQVG
jgi:hypothetical protein